MGCFATCFGTCKRSRRRRRRSLKSKPSLLDHLENYQSIDDFKVPQLIQEEDNEGEIEEEEEEEQKAEIENPIDLSPDTNDEKRVEANSSGRKKVTFDLNVKFYEDLRRDEEAEEINEEERVDDETGKNEVKAKKAVEFECQCGSDSSSSSLFSYPLNNNRYENCRDSDDEFDEILSSDESDIEYYTDEDDDDEEDDDGYGGEVESVIKDEKPVTAEQQSSESLFSLSIDSRRQNLGTGGGDKEVNSPMPIKNAPSNDSNSRYVDSVLSPVENVTQWKDIKARSRLVSKDQAKENLNSEQDKQDFSFPVKKECLQKEIAVDTSLSTWLGGSQQGTTKRTNSRNSSVSVGNSPSDRKSVSPNKFEDRPILGALTLEEIRQMSAASTPRKSPSRSPDDMPIIGTVGSYWSHTGQTTGSGVSSTKSTKSRYRESAEVIWDSTPFETRLEKALEKEANAAEVFVV